MSAYCSRRMRLWYKRSNKQTIESTQLTPCHLPNCTSHSHLQDGTDYMGYVLISGVGMSIFQMFLCPQYPLTCHVSVQSLQHWAQSRQIKHLHWSPECFDKPGKAMVQDRLSSRDLACIAGVPIRGEQKAAAGEEEPGREPSPPHFSTPSPSPAAAFCSPRTGK